MKLPFQPSLIHNNFFSNHLHPMEINFGDCYKWAWIAHKLFNDVELWSHESHAFIKYRGKFYDSEMLDGTKNYRRLRTIKESLGMFPSAVKMSPNEFIPYWGVYHQCDWNALNAKINLVGQSLVSKVLNGKSFQ